MKLLEYQAREIFEKYKIPVKNGVVIDHVENMEEKIEGLEFPLVVKAQIPVGGRGKAGGIQFADTLQEVKSICSKLLYSCLKGHKVNKLMIVEKAQGIGELYLSIIIDRRHKCPMIIFSAEGGVDIEEIAEKKPEAIIKVPIDPIIGLNKYTAQYIVNKSGMNKELTDVLFKVISNLYQLFMESDALLAEINPLLINGENQLIALDGKVDIDDSALYRQPKALAYRDSIQEEKLVLEARKYRFLYIPVEDGGNVSVISNGSGMLMSSIDLITKAGMKVGAVLDLGGGSTADRIKEAVRIVLSNTHIEYLFINIFGGITRCDEVAEGIKYGLKTQTEGRRVIVRLEGTNKALGIDILNSIDYHVISVEGLREGVAELNRRGKDYECAY